MQKAKSIPVYDLQRGAVNYHVPLDLLRFTITLILWKFLLDFQPGSVLGCPGYDHALLKGSHRDGSYP